MRWGRYRQFSDEDTKERFNTKIHKTRGCWNWTGGLCSGRYGNTRFRGKAWLAHRLAFYFATGKNPGKQIVMHSCDNGLCVRPSHLILGTQHENVLDAERKGRARHPFGENHGRAKLTTAAVLMCKWLHWQEGVSMGELARHYGVSRTVISLALKGKTWRHLATTSYQPGHMPR